MMRLTVCLLVLIVILKSHGAAISEVKDNDDDKKCSPAWFTKPKHQPTHNVFTVCPFMKGMRKAPNETQVTLEECQQEACRIGSNAINYRPANDGTSGFSECQLRKCGDGPIMPVRVLGGWDVFRRHKFGSCSVDSFVQEFHLEDGWASDCAPLRMLQLDTLEDCMKATCAAGGTVLNFRPGRGPHRGHCGVKLCDLHGIHVDPFRGGWDVYHSQTRAGKCEDTFVKLYDRTVGVSSHCVFRGHGTVTDAAGCAKLACEAKANVFNYHGRVCAYDDCRTPWLRLIHRHGWEVYSTPH